MKKLIIYLALKTIILITSSFSMFFGTMFNMLSKEQIENLIAKNAFNFYFSKFIISFSIGSFFFLFSLVINWFYRKDLKIRGIRNRIALFELVYYIIFSVLIVIIFMKSV